MVDINTFLSHLACVDDIRLSIRNYHRTNIIALFQTQIHVAYFDPPLLKTKLLNLGW